MNDILTTKKNTSFRLMLAVALFAAVGLTASQEVIASDDEHLGLIEYELACMPCHGIDGRGDGDRSTSLKTPPPDLTRIEKANQGLFPFKRVSEIIDGRASLAAHGTREMPVWGLRYRIPAEPSENPDDIEKRARTQIDALVKYLISIQVK